MSGKLVDKQKRLYPARVFGHKRRINDKTTQRVCERENDMEVAFYVVTALMFALGLLMTLIAWAGSLADTESEREGSAEFIALLTPLFAALALAFLVLASILDGG